MVRVLVVGAQLLVGGVDVGELLSMSQAVRNNAENSSPASAIFDPRTPADASAGAGVVDISNIVDPTASRHISRCGRCGGSALPVASKGSRSAFGRLAREEVHRWRTRSTSSPSWPTRGAARPLTTTPGRRHAVTARTRDLFVPGARAARRGRDPGDDPRQRRPVREEVPGVGVAARRGRQRRGRLLLLRPRLGVARQLQRSRPAGHVDDEGVPVAPARRPRRRHADAAVEPGQGRPPRPGRGVGSGRRGGPSRHARLHPAPRGRPRLGHEVA